MGMKCEFIYTEQQTIIDLEVYSAVFGKIMGYIKSKSTNNNEKTLIIRENY
jgi:hypothetical protein